VGKEIRWGSTLTSPRDLAILLPLIVRDNYVDVEHSTVDSEVAQSSAQSQLAFTAVKPAQKTVSESPAKAKLELAKPF
jgi:hypothetical protein